MALKQPNSGSVWDEPAGSGAAAPITPIAWVVDPIYGGYGLAANASPDARMLADAFGGFSLHAGADNPGALAEARMIQLDGTSGITMYL